MELSVSWLLHSASAFIGAVAVREMFVWLRNAIPKSVDCWFCMHKTEVPWGLRNSWYCPQCDQYNGFSKDGDYNKPLAQQYDERLNFSISTMGRNRKTWQPRKVLCNDCNTKQRFKVEQLAKFVPINERNYDVEIEHFKVQIDKAYQLCSDCDMLINRIFTKERQEFGLPRRLNNDSGLPKVAKGTAALYLNVIVSVALCFTGFIQTGWAVVLKRELQPFADKIVKNYVDKKYVNLIAPQLIKTTAISCVDYIALIGAFLSLVAYFRSQKGNVLLLFNSLTWLIFLGFSLWAGNRSAWLPSCEIIFGLTSCAFTLYVLLCIYSEAKRHQERQQAMLQPKLFHTPKNNYSELNSTWTKQQTLNDIIRPPNTSTPRNTPPESLFSSVEQSNITTNVWRAGLDTLEPRIRELNLNSSRTRSGKVFSPWNSDRSVASTITAPVKNYSTWTTFGGGPNLSINSAPPGLGRPSSCCSRAALSHIYAASTIGEVPSRPVSPEMPSPSASLFASQTSAKLAENFLRNRQNTSYSNLSS